MIVIFIGFVIIAVSLFVVLWMLFTSLFAIVATAMLIPRDVEDRTLYTR